MPNTATGKSRAVKIVLAEDEEIIALAYQEGFGYLGYEIVVAKDGLEALAAIKKQRPDILLLDLIMPNMNGFETLKALRSDPLFSDLPIIVVSNLSQPADEIKARELGANDYLIKSDHSLQEVAARIEVVLDTLGVRL